MYNQSCCYVIQNRQINELGYCMLPLIKMLLSSLVTFWQNNTFLNTTILSEFFCASKKKSFFAMRYYVIRFAIHYYVTSYFNGKTMLSLEIL